MTDIAPHLAPLDAPTLVEASAGTGKTYAITTYFVRGILERGLTPEQILVVTYTKAATAELRVRTRKRIVDALALLDGPAGEDDVLRTVVAETVRGLGRDETENRLRTALATMDRAAILTIHGFCQRLLQDYPLSFGIDFDFEVAEDTTSIQEDLAVDFWVSELYHAPDWLLRTLDQRGIDVDHLTKLAGATSMPNVRVLGPEPVELDEVRVEAWLELRRQAAVLWREHRDDVIAILLHDPGLSGVSYKEKSIRETWVPELDDFFAGGGFIAPPKCLDKLAQGRMRVKKGCEQPRHRFLEACARLDDATAELQPMLEYAVFSIRRRFIAYVRERAHRRQRETAVLTFDDLLTLVHAPFDEAARGAGLDGERIQREVLRELPMALVDEFQDTDSIQYGIFKSIYGEASVVYVGDPKQAIYAFRGADVFSYIAAAEDTGRKPLALTTNRRSDPGVITAVNTLFELRKPPFVLEQIGIQPALPHQRPRSTLASPMDVVLLSADEIRTETASITADEVVALLGDGVRIEERPLTPGDVAVLCRSNRQSLEVTEALRAKGVPVSLDGDASVLDTEVARDLRAVLAATLMPGDSSLVRRALLTSLLDVSPGELAAMQDETWSRWVARFHSWNATWHAHGIVRFLEDMLRETDAETVIAHRTDNRRALTDLLHIQELLLRGERERHRDPIALMQWFRRLEGDSPEGGMVANEDLQQRADADEAAVRVSTIHKSKGLEYGVVFLPYTWGKGGLWSQDRKIPRFHDERNALAVDLGSPDLAAHLEKAENEAMSESLRVLYVGVTRAKYGCILFWGPGGDWKTSALGYLLHGRGGASKPYDESVAADVASFVDRSEGTVRQRRPRRDPGTMQRQPRGGVLMARERTRHFRHAPRIASFTSLTGHEEKTPAPRSADAPPERSGLFVDLPGGVRTGLLLHSILERADLSDLAGPSTTRVIDKALRDFGFEVELGAGIQRDLETVGQTSFHESANEPRLSDLASSKTLRELEFTLHVDRPRLESLAALLEKHGAGGPGYPQKLREIGSNTLHGFLRGFIDLMFEWNGRWYVADYKSNSLPSYAHETIADAVQREHYVLQGLLYSAAAHRYLRQRLRDYDPELHWGGSLFLFLRGMRGGAGESVFFEPQTAALLRGLDQWLGGLDGAE